MALCRRNRASPRSQDSYLESDEAFVHTYTSNVTTPQGIADTGGVTIEYLATRAPNDGPSPLRSAPHQQSDDPTPIVATGYPFSCLYTADCVTRVHDHNGRLTTIDLARVLADQTRLAHGLMA